MKNKVDLQKMYLLNILVYTFGSSLITYSSILINKLSYHSILIPIFTIIISTVLILFIPNNQFKINKIKNSVTFKFILISYNLLSTILLTYFTIKILSTWFYTNTSIFIFVIFFSLISLLGLIKINTIIRTGFIGSIFFIFILTTLIFIQNDLELTFIKPLNINLNNILNTFFYLTIPLDNLIYCFIESNTNNLPNKKTIIKGTILALILSTIQLFLSFTIVNYRFYESLEIPGINIFFMFYTKNYIGHYDIALIILLLITYFYKSSLYNNISLQFFKKKSWFICLLFSVITCIILLNIINKPSLIDIITWLMFILIVLIYLTLIIPIKEDVYDKL